MRTPGTASLHYRFDFFAMRSRFLIGLVFCALAGLGVFAALRDGSRANNGWGIDACLSCHLPSAKVPGYVSLLRSSKILWVRERGTGSVDGPERRVWRAEARAGFRVVAFAGLPHPVPVEQEGNQLPEDLLAVYRESARLGAETRGLVSAWEMVGEPDTSYCRDLPDRVAAFQKAVYLGLKDGAAEGGVVRSWFLVPGSLFAGSSRGWLGDPASPNATKNKERRTKNQQPTTNNTPLVLSGAFGYPPGPWADLAGANGLYDYTDAINVHHYGFARDFGDVVEAHRVMAGHWRKGPPLPVWVTEAGLNNIPYKDWENAAARRAQSDYLLSCARQAIAANVSVFMPFILTHRGDPFSMTRDAARPYPAWTDYEAFTRAHRLEMQPSPANAPSRVVLQWLPDNQTCTPSKVARAYWFDSLDPGEWMSIEGELRVYNFGAGAASVRLDMEATSPRLRVTCATWPTGRDLEIPPLGCVKLPLEISLEGAGYLRAVVRCTARVAGEDKPSRVEFWLETPPDESLGREARPLDLIAPEKDDDFAYISEAPFEATGRNAQWLGINGARPVEARTADGEATFDVTDRNVDPLSPPMAIARLPEGLPATRNGFLRVQARGADGSATAVRVDVIDQDGQRFSIVENLGRTPGAGARDTVWLAYANFHPWVFGRCRPGAKFDPARAREIQLRFCDAVRGKQFRVRLDAVEFR